MCNDNDDVMMRKQWPCQSIGALGTGMLVKAGDSLDRLMSYCLMMALCWGRRNCLSGWRALDHRAVKTTMSKPEIDLSDGVLSQHHPGLAAGDATCLWMSLQRLNYRNTARQPRQIPTPVAVKHKRQGAKPGNNA